MLNQKVAGQQTTLHICTRTVTKDYIYQIVLKTNSIFIAFNYCWPFCWWLAEWLTEWMDGWIGQFTHHNISSLYFPSFLMQVSGGPIGCNWYYARIKVRVTWPLIIIIFLSDNNSSLAFIICVRNVAAAVVIIDVVVVDEVEYTNELNAPPRQRDHLV